MFFWQAARQIQPKSRQLQANILYMHVTVGTYSVEKNVKNGAGPNNRYPVLKVVNPTRSSDR